MARAVSGFGGERGSALLISLVLIFVMTVLGLAFFDLGVLENRLVGASETELRAFEIAQTGIERALRELRNDVVSDADLANGTPVCSPSPCVTDQFRSFPVSNNGFNNGTYSLQLKLVKQADVPPGVTGCLPNGAATPVCRNLIFIRSTGQLSGTAGYSPTRTTQVLARATSTGVFSPGAATAGAGSGQPIAGNALILGTVQIVGGEGQPSLSFNAAAAGQRNNYAALDNPQDLPTLNRLLRPKPVCPRLNVKCNPGEEVESLGAVLRVDKPVSSPAVTVTPGTLGQQNDTAPYPNPDGGSRRGKGPLDDVRVANGCQNPDCSDNFTSQGSGNIFVDLPKRECNGCVTLFSLEDTKSTFAHYASPAPTLSAPCDTANVFFCANGVNAALVCTSSLCPDGNPRIGTLAFTCGGPCPPLPSTLAELLGGPPTNAPNGLGVKWPGNSGPSSNPLPPFTATLPVKGISPAGQICWTGATLIFGCDVVGNPTPTPVKTPFLIYSNSPVRIAGDTSGALQTINYTGSAVILSRDSATDPGVRIEGIVQTAYPVPVSCNTGETPPCNRKFAKDDLLVVMTFGNLEIGRNQSNIARVMGFFLTQKDVTVRKQTTVVGALAARDHLCFAGGCGDNSGNVPRLVEVPADPSDVQDYLPSTSITGWSVSQVRPFWKACVGTGTPGSTTPCDGVTFP